MQKKTFAELLKEYRTEYNLSQTQLAKKVGVSRPMISYYENGHSVPQTQVVVSIAKELGLSTDEILDFTNNDKATDNSNNQMEIGERLQFYRAEKGYSIHKVAYELGVAPSTLYRYENGEINKMPIQHIFRLASLYSTTPTNLMGWTENEYMDLSDAERNIVYTFRNAVKKAQIDLSDTERSIINAYRNASEDTQTAVRNVLAIK